MSKEKTQRKFHRKEGGFRLFGLDRQDLIRYFFGGNASLAIFILVLICVFLFLQGKNFLPEYHQSLQIARGSGIDLHDMVDKQYGDIKRFNAGLNRAFTTEYYYPGRHQNDLVKAHESVRFLVEKGTRRDRTVLRDLEKKIKEYKPAAAPAPETVGSADAPPEPAFVIDPEKVVAFQDSLAEFTAELGSLPPPDAPADQVKAKRMALLRTLYETRKSSHDFNPPEPVERASPTEAPPGDDERPSLEKLEAIREKLIAQIATIDRAALDGIDKSDIREARDISDEEFAAILADIRALAENPGAKDRDFPLYQEFVAERDRLNAAKLDHAKPLNTLFLDLKKKQQPLDDLWSSIMKHAVDTKTRSQTAVTLTNRIRGPFGIYRLAEEPQVRAEKLAMMLKECASAELFHPGARLFYIGGLDTLIQGDLALLAVAAAAEAEEKAGAVTDAAAKLRTALADPSDTGTLRTAYAAFDFAADAAQKALLKMQSPSGHYSDFFHGDDGKAAFVELENHLEIITAAVPDYSSKFRGGTFGEAELADLETAAGDKGKIDPELAGKLLESVSALPDAPVEFAGSLTDLAGDFQLPFPYGEFAVPLYEAAKNHGSIIAQLKSDIADAVEQAPDNLESPYAIREIEEMRKNLDGLFAEIDDYSEEIAVWKHDDQQTALGTLGAFVAGTKWTNNSAIQDRYGLLPLLAGSFIISIIAISVAVPIGISGAIYVNQIAGPRQQAFLKPVTEFIGVIPSIVLGFLGIAVLGDFLKDVSESAFFDWMPGLPIVSRLNMLTAALLLAFMSIPTIFSLAEDALNNVPDYLRQGSLALGATNLQTAFKVVVPAAISGIIAAVLLGFGRVIGETMVVLLVAGNRISLPEMQPAIEWVGVHPATAGALLIGSVGAIVLGVFVRVKKGHRGGPLATLASVFAFFPIAALAFFLLSLATQPSHTMTGIIAQGLGEASVGSTGWQALFMVGLVLFTVSLVINFVAQKVVNSYSIESQILKKKKPTSVDSPPPTVVDDDVVKARSAV